MSFITITCTYLHKYTPTIDPTNNPTTQQQQLYIAPTTPQPQQVENFALDLDKGEEKVAVHCDTQGAPVALAFKLEEGKFGQLTYMRWVGGGVRVCFFK